jgi:hypothetical protein
VDSQTAATLKSVADKDFKCTVTALIGLLAQSLAHGYQASVENLRCLVIKNGSHIQYWRQLGDLCPGGAAFIHLFRDPRAVVASKLRTTRPYARGEVMAWGGAMLASMRWCLYSAEMRKATRNGASVLDISYEDFVFDPERELGRIALFTQSLLATNRTNVVYEVPPDEANIHKSVGVGEIMHTENAKWKSDLSSWQLKVIEAVCQGEMKRRGYVPTVHRSYLHRIAIISCALPEAMFRTAKHLMPASSRPPHRDSSS